MASPGPYPNSVRYDHSPKALAQAPKGSPWIAASCLKGTLQRASFSVVQYDQDGNVSMIVICREWGDKACVATAHWHEIWPATVYVSRAYLQRIPEFMKRLKSLYDAFEAAANAQSERERSS